MGTRGIWLELFENLMKTKGFWWVFELIGTIWEIDENKRISMGYWGEQEEFDWNYLRTWWKQKDFDWLLMGTRGIWLEPFENLMRTKGFWWVIDGNKRNLFGTIWELDENKRILMGYWWEQEEFDGSCLRIWWEQQIEIEPAHPFKKKETSHGGMLMPLNWLSSHALS
jgi:hypothetical protein